MTEKEIAIYCRGMFDFDPVPYQLGFMYSCLNKKRVSAVFCRQSGKSESTAKVAIMLAKRNPGHRVLIFAPTDRQTGLLAEKIKHTVARMITSSRNASVKHETMREFYFKNGSTIKCETTGDSGETIRGYTADTIILEEAGSIKDSIIHSVIMPMGATTDATIIKIGTPRGMNHFYESSQDPDYVVHQISWREAVEQGIISREYVEGLRKNLPRDRFETEMEAQFIPDEDAYFGYDLVQACVENIEQVENRSSEEKAKNYYLGADIARMGQDSTCLMILRRDDDKNRIVKIVDIPKATLDYIIQLIIELHQRFRFEKMFIDETGLGAGVRDVLARQYNIYRSRNPATQHRDFSISDTVIGIKFTIQSKIDIFSKLKVMMEQDRIAYPKNEKLIAQLRDFRYETTVGGNVKLHHSEYGHDDYVDALALAAQGPMIGGDTVIQFA